MKFIISIILTSIPIISWYFQNFFSKKEIFKKNWTCYYGDWIFVPINFLFIYSIKINYIIIYFLIFSLISNIIIHKYWSNLNKKNETISHLFKDGKLKKAGYVHLIFSTIQTTIILSLLFLKPILPIYYIQSFLIIGLGIIFIYGSFKVNSKITILDAIVSFSLIIFTIIRTLFLNM